MSDLKYRKAALERLASPERLDQLIRVTDSRGWLALAGLSAVIASAITWSVLGSIPDRANGRGILIRTGATSVVTTDSGQVESVLVAVGDDVEAGQVVATLATPELAREAAAAGERARQLEAELHDARAFAERQTELRHAQLAQLRAHLADRLADADLQERILRERVASLERLLEKSVVTKRTVLDARREAEAMHAEVGAIRQDLALTPLTEMEADDAARQRVAQALERAEVQRAEADALDARQAESRVVVAPLAGRVLELQAKEGSVLPAGAPILTLELPGGDLTAIAYVPADRGKRIRTGMDAEVSPATVKREERGFVRGRVTAVSEFPATSRGMLRLLANEELVSSFVAAGPLVEVRVALLADPDAPGCYLWSTSRGPGTQLTSGTLATASVIVERTPPIRLLLPKLRGVALGSDSAGDEAWR